MRSIVVSLILVFVCNCLLAQNFKVADIFTDHMVIQQGINAPVWGWAKANEKIKISFAGYETIAISDTSGKWIARMPSLTAGGPYIMSISSASGSAKYSDVMIGEVWLASGQSNMSFRVSETINGKQVMADTAYDLIREYHVPYRVSGWTVNDIPGAQWKTCNSKTVGNFSAVGFFFAKALYNEQHIAVGIINCSEGGTPAEAWTSAGMLLTNPDFRNRMLQLKQSPENWQELDSLAGIVQAAYKKQVDTAREGERRGVQLPNYDDSKWKQADYPLNAESLGMGGYQFIWARKQIDLPASFKNKKLTINLGKVIHQDIFYFNGVKIAVDKQPGNRIYVVPANLVKTGKNSIAVRLLSEWGYGRIGNIGDEPTIVAAGNATPLSLKGAWMYSPDIEKNLTVGREYSLEPSSLFNGMLYPVIPYGIKGMMWYQGEGNSDKAYQYNALLNGLITDWRIRFQEGNIPFLVVQLPNYRPGGNNWVQMRETQKNAAQNPNTGVAVTLDLGDPEDVHPLNKQPVGERLYKIARHLAYNQKGIWGGPIYDSMTVTGSEANIIFSEAENGLILKGDHPEKSFLISGSDEHFFPADKITVEGNVLKVSSQKVSQPVSVRYAWEGNPAAALYNKEELPASPFRTDSFKFN